MKYDELQEGKTYYHHNKIVTPRGRRNKHDRQHFIYRILKANKKNKSVLASCNGMPPIVYGAAYYKHWVREMPEELKTLKNTA